MSDAVLERIAERSAKCRFYADMINAYRVVPRIIMVVYFVFFIHAWYFVVNWFMKFDWTVIPETEIVGTAAVTAVAGFPAVILGILTKILKDLTVSYWNGSSSKGDGH